VGAGERPTEQDHRSPEEQERQDDAEGQINFGDAASYCPEAGSLLPGNPPEGAKNSDDEGSGRNPLEDHTPKEPLCLGVICPFRGKSVTVSGENQAEASVRLVTSGRGYPLAFHVRFAAAHAYLLRTVPRMRRTLA